METAARYIGLAACWKAWSARPGRYEVTASDRIDRMLTIACWGADPVAQCMLIMFQAVFSWAKPLMDLISHGIDRCGGWVEGHSWPKGPCAACWSTA